MFNKIFKLLGISESPEVNPIDEADVYLAYGREVQAIEILKDAIRQHPDNMGCYFKLIQILAHRKEIAEMDAILDQHGSKIEQSNPAMWQAVQDLHLSLKVA